MTFNSRDGLPTSSCSLFVCTSSELMIIYIKRNCTPHRLNLQTKQNIQHKSYGDLTGDPHRNHTMNETQDDVLNGQRTARLMKGIKEAKPQHTKQMKNVKISINNYSIASTQMQLLFVLTGDL